MEIVSIERENIMHIMTERGWRQLSPANCIPSGYIPNQLAWTPEYDRELDPRFNPQIPNLRSEGKGMAGVPDRHNNPLPGPKVTAFMKELETEIQLLRAARIERRGGDF